MKHKILAYTFIVLVFAATVSLLYYFEVDQAARNADIDSGFIWNPSPSDKSGETGQRIYKNADYGFELKYPKTYQLKVISDPDEKKASYFVKDGVAVARIQMPKDAFPGTNFSQGWADVAVREHATRGQCQTYVTGGEEYDLMEEKVKVGANTFYTVEFSGAAAGTKYDTTLYRLLNGETCYELELTAGISNIGNYDPASGIKEVDEDQIWAELNAIAATFQLIE